MLKDRLVDSSWNGKFPRSQIEDPLDMLMNLASFGNFNVLAGPLKWVCSCIFGIAHRATRGPSPSLRTTSHDVRSGFVFALSPFATAAISKRTSAATIRHHARSF